MYSRRDTHEKGTIALSEVATTVKDLLDDIQKTMFAQSSHFLHSHIVACKDMDEFEKALDGQNFVKAMWCGSRDCEDEIKASTAASARVLPFDQTPVGDRCVCCGKPATKVVYFAKSY